MEKYNHVLVLSCPEKMKEFIGRKGSACIDENLILTFGESDGLKTSAITSHDVTSDLHRVTTASGSRYEFKVIDTD